MEKLIVKVESPVYDLKVGKEYNVKRTLMGDCVLEHDNPMIRRVRFTEDKLKSYGELKGKRRSSLVF